MRAWGGLCRAPGSYARAVTGDAPIAPLRRQRLAAYAVVLRGNEVLLTQLSGRTSAPGRWTLPGGGVDHGEDPRDTVVREVHEETGLDVSVGRLLGNTSMHFVGTSPRGVVEDFHAVRLVFAATVAADAPPPRVVEVGGTTVAAAWHRLADVLSGAVDAVDLVRAAIDLSANRSAAAQAVADAHADLGIIGPDAPVAAPDGWPRRLELLQHAADRYAAAAAADDVVGVATALADLAHVLYGTAHVHGVPLDEVFDEMHRSAMAVSGADSDSPRHRHPDVAAVLARPRRQAGELGGGHTF